MRFLCLHGKGTNSRVFELQTVTLRYELGSQHEFIFAEGSLHCSPASGQPRENHLCRSTCILPFLNNTQSIRIFFPQPRFATELTPRRHPGSSFFEEECYAYFEETPDSLGSAIQDLKEYIASNGPFDGVLGFSQGAGLAASIICHQARQGGTNADVFFRCAVFICAPGAWDSSGKGRRLHASVDGEVIQIPVANILGCRDPNYEWGIGLSKLCDGATREIMEHEGGHEVPRRLGPTQEMARSITAVINKALLIR